MGKKTQAEINKELEALGIKPETATEIANYATWKPWDDDEQHSEDPHGFQGKYMGFKCVEKIMDKKKNTFGVFMFEDCKPAPKGGQDGYVVMSTILIDTLPRVPIGTRIGIVYAGSEKNHHGGKTNDVRAVFVDPKDKQKLLATPASPFTRGGDNGDDA